MFVKYIVYGLLEKLVDAGWDRVVICLHVNKYWESFKMTIKEDKSLLI
jgi:hypothetical protein